MRSARLAPCLVLALTAAAGRPSGRALLEEVNARPRPTTSAVSMVVTVQPDGRPRQTWGVVAYQRDDGIETRSLITVRTPSTMAGLGVLRWEGFPDGDADWLFARGLPEPLRFGPALGRLRLFDTQFTLADARERLRLDAYDFRWAGRTHQNGRPCEIVEAGVRDETLGYSRVTGWIDTERKLLVRAKYYDPGGRPLKVFRARDVRLVDGAWIAHLRAMRAVPGGAWSSFRIEEMRSGMSLPDDLFSPASLAEGRGRCFPVPCRPR